MRLFLVLVMLLGHGQAWHWASYLVFSGAPACDDLYATTSFTSALGKCSKITTYPDSTVKIHCKDGGWSAHFYDYPECKGTPNIFEGYENSQCINGTHFNTGKPFSFSVTCTGIVDRVPDSRLDFWIATAIVCIVMAVAMAAYVAYRFYHERTNPVESQPLQATRQYQALGEEV